MSPQESIPEIHRAMLAAAVNAIPSGWTRRGHAPLPDLRKTVKLRIEIEGTSYEVAVEVLPEDPTHQSAEIEIPEAVTRPRKPLKLLEDTFCRSPIAGRVVAVLAVAGQTVSKNEPVLVIEAMKMEIQISGAVDGIIKGIYVKPGESVSSGQLLFELT
uniref:Biotin/lipoyl attachment domain-containing protein n=1 Tax=Solibacter usitatus (strain Ellin6076) TaxID=234267 RepID=Q025R7_SOLUE